MGKRKGQTHFFKKKPRLKLLGIACLLALLGGAIAFAGTELAESADNAVKAGTHVDGIEYYVALDGGWQRIASDTNVPGKDTIAGAVRYYTTPSALEEYYGAFGFQAEKYNGERVFPHSAGLDTEQIWADVASVKDDNGEWKVPLATKDKIYVYYLPDNIEGSSSYFNKNKSLDDETVLNANMFYSITVSDPDGKASEVQDVTYVRSGRSYEVTLPIEDGYGWECVNNHTFDTVKYEHSDGWHVDGILVAKAGKIVVKKTFAGSADAAITKLQDDFNITVSHKDADSNAKEENTDYKLVLKEQENAGENETGYTSYDASTHTYTWVLTVRDYQQYEIKEHNYKLSSFDRSEHTYTIRHSQEETARDDAKAASWQTCSDEEGISVTADSYPDDAPQSSYQTVELKNTYVSSSFITLDKLDAFTVDGMKDVMFKVNKLGAQDDDASFQLYRRTDANAYGDEYDKM